jgi:hypothetical protein
MCKACHDILDLSAQGSRSSGPTPDMRSSSLGCCGLMTTRQPVVGPRCGNPMQLGVCHPLVMNADVSQRCLCGVSEDGMP